MFQNKATLPTHPGELIADEIEYAGWSIEKAAEKMDFSIEELKSLIECKIPISKQACKKADVLFNLEYDMLLRLQSDWDKRLMDYYYEIHS